MLFKLPASLKYPITITALLKQPNDRVERYAPLFDYTYKTTVIEGDGLGNKKEVERTYPTVYRSEVDGVLKAWKIEKGGEVQKSEYVKPSPSRTKLTGCSTEFIDIEEECSHSVQFGGMCVNCGKDMAV